MIRNTRIDWSNFTKLRNEDTHCIEAAICNSCKSIIHSYSDKRFQNHRYSKIVINSFGYIMLHTPTERPLFVPDKRGESKIFFPKAGFAERNCL
ncbi:hypothetical protein TSAR_006155 [Trichomalopsis sarcophagae]|uniref:Uncharacterized protein n=1 Tax=Trichomalopsis sarcophagae TaxID=543379 RepID=A0A232EDD3_9HYME|nr:hypothetical protein TSAR_006155 [Trichomalopsis sarcophagae]